MIQVRFVGRQRQLAHLRSSLAHAGRGRIICITAGPGMGKSWLVREFAHQAVALAARSALIDFGTDQAYDVLTLVRQLRDALGAEAFAPLTATINTLTAPRIATSAARQQQITRADATPAATTVKDKLFVVQTDNPLLLQAIEAQVTHAFFVCLAGLATQGPLLLLFDSYEQCSHERTSWVPSLADRWIRGELLNRIRSGTLPNTVVLLAGRQLPPFDAGWTAVLDELPLEGFAPQEVAAYLRGTCGVTQLSDHELQTIYEATQGHPQLLGLIGDSLAQARSPGVDWSHGD